MTLGWMKLCSGDGDPSVTDEGSRNYALSAIAYAWVTDNHLNSQVRNNENGNEERTAGGYRRGKFRGCEQKGKFYPSPSPLPIAALWGMCLGGEGCSLANPHPNRHAHPVQP